MAATRLITVHQNKGKSVAKSLSDRTDYAKNGEKIENGQFISSYACQAESVDEEFMLSKREYERLTGRHPRGNIIAYQIRQSFKPGEITPEEANQVGYETAMRFTKGNHAFIVATHTDKAHIHNHIIFNSTSLDCTHKFRDFFFVGLALQRLSDIICLEHGLNLLAGNKSITPLAYINSIEKDDSGLIGYLNKMVQFHMMNILNKDIYERIAKSTASGITEEWNQYIGMIDQQDSNYKNWIKEHFALVGQKYQQNRGEDQTINDIEKIYTVELYKLLEREVHYSMDTLHDEKGNLVIRTYMRVFDKKEQKYIEGLDQIIDSVFQIDFSDEQ